ncbi:hypothetical protein K461DRAFT_276765 [Myriangium duriaei CBS 260.36]|uniref:Secreted protein n=1 Tax=Myriangium duriaei CBS 260.36 TaxID=1168546 RepID=A0A9P4J430_9PEZI|nr:hypothetical protein K461DRAFT_276765 [Myriangium duriaei CBS 260.36]
MLHPAVWLLALASPSLAASSARGAAESASMEKRTAGWCVALGEPTHIKTPQKALVSTYSRNEVCSVEAYTEGGTDGWTDARAATLTKKNRTR